MHNSNNKKQIFLLVSLVGCLAGLFLGIIQQIPANNSIQHPDSIADKTESLPELIYSDIEQELPTLEISIDIRPCKYPNSINLESHGYVPVAIINENIFDLTLIDVNSIKFGPAQASPSAWVLTDVDEDGDYDIVFRFVLEEIGFESDQISAILTGSLENGQIIYGEDEIKIVS